MRGAANENDQETTPRRRPERSARTARNARPARSTEHLRHVVNPFEPLRVLSEDHVEHLHRSAVRFLGEHGIRVLLPEAREIFAAAGATVGDRDDAHIVRLPEELVHAALAAAPSTCTVAARNPQHDLTIGGRSVNFFPVGGPPYMSDLVHGRRPGTLAGFEDFVRLTQSFDVLHSNSPFTEPQDVPVQLPPRHHALDGGAVGQADLRVRAW
jgi:trimethylamine--corrinoid protein Co-methyltransferase